METLRCEYLKHAELEMAQRNTIRLKLFRIAARVRESVGRLSGDADLNGRSP